MAIKDITTLERLTRLPYQSAKEAIGKMEVSQCEKLFTELQNHLTYTYGQTAGYAAPKLVAVKVDQNGERDPIFKPAPVRPKDFNAFMGAIKKLEVLYGYFFDRLNNTQFAEVR